MAAKTEIKSAGFVHLHNHSHYSLLDGLQKIPEMLDRVKALGMDAVALTDHGTLSGTIEFYQKAKERGIKAIIGMEAYIAPRAHTEKSGREDANPFHLTLLAMNNQGYQNLMRLSTISHQEGFYYKPRLDRQLLEKYHEGLIVLSGCINGELGNALRQGQSKQAEEIASWYKRVFGDRYYLEAQDHGHMWSEQDRVNNQLLVLAKKLKLPVVVTADAHYAEGRDQDAHEVLLCVQTASLLSEDRRLSLKDMDLFVSDPKDIAKRWAKHPEVLTNTRLVADRCQVDIEFGHMLIPNFKTPGDISEHDYLEKLAYTGLAWRYGGKKPIEASQLSINQIVKLVDEVKTNRLQFELETIASLGLSSYFLIVADFINWAKAQGIIVGPGRGSAAGSIVSYALNITDIDPLEYDLLFERFLNPERISMPDIDIDFQDDRRDEVIDYVREKYGEDRVAHIVTFGTMAARNAIRDTSRVLGFPYSEADRLAKMVPPPVQGRHTPLSTHIQRVPELKQEYRINQRAKEVIDLAIRLEGTIRSHGVHAAGVVIAPDELTKFAPLEIAQSGVVATQYSMNPIEDLGLLKMDFLGLSNLTIIKNALRIIRKVENKNISLSELPLEDKATFELLSRGETTGVFQLESTGMKRYLKQLKPNRFEDIMSMVSLYRPGPMQFIDDFIARKHGRQKVGYLHPKMENALKETYGILVYQEQVMQVAKDMCGFSGGQADTLRKAIGKKIPTLLAKMREEFIEGGITTSNVSRPVMEKFWKQLEDFAAYCFNKSHAACYAMIAYQTAYLKAHYPEAFMAALLTSDHEDTDRVAIEVSECRQRGIEVLKPDINESFVEFAVVPSKGGIRFGLAAIKNVGDGAANAIVEERKHGEYRSIADFVQRIGPDHVNRKTWESLIKAGAFDELADRATLLFNLDHIIGFASKLHKQISSGQVDLFAGGSSAATTDLQLAKAQDSISERESLAWERQLLGIYLSKHPLEDFQQYLSSSQPIIEITTEMEGQTVSVSGFITAVRKIITRNGSSMAFVTIEDLGGSIEIIVFPQLLESGAELWNVDQIVKISGRISSKDRDGRIGSDIKIMADNVEDLEAAINQTPSAKSGITADITSQTGELVIKVSDSRDKAKLAKMKQLLGQHGGDSLVTIVIGRRNPTRIRLPFTVRLSSELQGALEELFSKEAVTVDS